MNDTLDIASPPLSERHLEPDLGCAAFLIATGYDLVALERVGRRYGFEFAPAAGQAAAQYRQGAVVVAKDYNNALAWLKDQLYAEKFRNGENSGQQKQYRR